MRLLTGRRPLCGQSPGPATADAQEPAGWRPISGPSIPSPLGGTEGPNVEEPAPQRSAEASLVGPGCRAETGRLPVPQLAQGSAQLWSPGAQDRVSSGHFPAGGGSPLNIVTRQC